MTEAKPEQASTRAIVRATSILNSFIAGGPYQSLTDIARNTGLDKSTTRRMLLTLTELGYLTVDERTKQYSLGLRLLELSAALPIQNLRTLARQELQSMAEATRCTAFVSVLHEDRALCVERVSAPSEPVQIRLYAMGQALPLNCGAAPRLLLAHQSPDAIERYLEGTLTRMTPRSVTDRKQLLDILERVRVRGWEVAIDDVIEGISAAAVPIRDDAGNVVAALSLGGLTQVLMNEGEPRHLSLLQQCAQRIARLPQVFREA